MADRDSRTFPTLTPAQVARAATHGTLRPLQAEDVLFDAGSALPSFFIVRTGRIEVARPAATGGSLITVLGPGQFTG